jgi:hypothetical protein
VRLAPGEVYRLTISGKALKHDGFTYAATSPMIGVIPMRLAVSEYSGGIPALGFEIVVDPSVKPGQYSLFAEDRDGLRNYMLGCLWIE